MIFFGCCLVFGVLVFFNVDFLFFSFLVEMFKIVEGVFCNIGFWLDRFLLSKFVSFFFFCLFLGLVLKVFVFFNLDFLFFKFFVVKLNCCLYVEFEFEVLLDIVIVGLVLELLELIWILVICFFLILFFDDKDGVVEVLLLSFCLGNDILFIVIVFLFWVFFFLL